jgi:endonuclease/exonuclease/phosphatase (EEP) superfamily protein YafD
VLEWLRTNPADVVVLQEVTPAWQRTLAATLDEYEHRFLLARRDPYGIGVLSRVPLEHTRTVDLAGDGLPSVVTELGAGDQRVQLVGLHTHWPVTPGLLRARDLSLRNVVREVRRSPLPSIAAGDLNLTPYAPAFAPLLANSGLRDAFAGLRWRPTWSASFWPFALPIDHVLVPPEACVVSSTIGGDVGSDHRPVHVTLRLRR